MNNHCAHACVFVLTEHLWAYELMALRTYRCGERIVHIPFFSPSRETTSQELQKWEQELKLGRLENSACIGHLIAIGSELTSAARQQHINSEILPYVASHLHGLPYRLHSCYALLLAMAEMVCY